MIKVQSQKVVLTRIMCKNVVFIKKNDSREKSFLLEKRLGGVNGNNNENFKCGSYNIFSFLFS